MRSVVGVPYPEFYAFFVNPTLKSTKICNINFNSTQIFKICGKFNAKYGGSTLNSTHSTQNYVRKLR